MITRGELRNLIEYDPETGLWRWRDRSPLPPYNRRASDWFIGMQTGHGYLTIRIDGKKYLAHRLAWFYVYGDFPTALDHANRNRSDNRLANLRIASCAENAINAKVRSTNKSGTTGVRQSRSGNWTAYITYLGARFYATFKTEDQAVAWRKSEQERLYDDFGKIVHLNKKQTS